MRLLKFAGIALGILLVAIVALIAYISVTFDSVRLKTELAQVVQEKKQRTLRIDGDVALSFWPNLGVRLDKVSLSEHASEQQFAAVDTARVSVALMPLLSGQIVVDTVELAGAKVIVIKHKDGTLNIADLLSQDDSKSTAVQASIAGIKVTDAQLTWRDEGSGEEVAVADLDLDTGRIDVDTGAGTYRAEQVALTATGKRNGDDFEVRVEAPSLSLTPGEAKGDRVVLTAKLSGGGRASTVTLTAAGLTGNAEKLDIGTLTFDADTKAGDSSAKLHLDTALKAALAQQEFSFDKLAGKLALVDPKLPMKSLELPLDGRLRINLAKPSAAGALSTRLDDSSIALQFAVERFSPLALSFDLGIDQINVDKYLPPEAAEDGKKGDGEEGKIDFSALKGLDLQGNVRIGKLQVNNVKASDIKLKIRAANGKLDIAPHSMNLYNGSAVGALSVNASNNGIVLREKLNGVDINPLMRDAARQDVIEGRGDVMLDVNTHGDTVTVMKKALAGTASLALKNGALKGINLAKSFRELKAKFSAKEDAVQQAKADDKTDFSELTASFRIANGVAHNDDLSAKSPFLRLAGAGDIDIGNSRIDYLAKASVVATSGGQGAKDLEHLKGVTVPVRVSGPFDQLSYKLEIASLAQEAAKARVEEKKQEIKERAEEKKQEVKQRAKEKLLKELFK